MKIKTKREKIEAKIDKLHEQLEALKKQCPHEHYTKTYRGESGNYDPSHDWSDIEWVCEDCELRVHTTQNIGVRNLKHFPTKEIVEKDKLGYYV
jgi:hypothetical protein